MSTVQEDVSEEKLSGKLIVLDGPDGCGKTTQTERLVQYLKDQGFNTVHIKDPGGTRLGDSIRKLLLNPENEEMGEKTELLLYMASRAQLVQEILLPALRDGKIVVSERYIASSLAYQGYGVGLGREAILSIGEFAIGPARPDLTIIIDVDPEKGLNRKGTPPDRIEQRGIDFCNRVREGFHDLASADPARIKLIPDGGSIEEVHEKIKELVADVLR